MVLKFGYEFISMVLELKPLISILGSQFRATKDSFRVSEHWAEWISVAFE